MCTFMNQNLALRVPLEMIDKEGSEKRMYKCKRKQNRNKPSVKSPNFLSLSLTISSYVFSFRRITISRARTTTNRNPDTNKIGRPIISVACNSVAIIFGKMQCQIKNAIKLYL